MEEWLHLGGAHVPRIVADDQASDVFVRNEVILKP
jgi:hypothetical protein